MTMNFSLDRPRSASRAGGAYVAAWVVGLAAFGAGPAAGASTDEIAAWFADHRVTSALQAVLVHGVAAVALAAVLLVARRRAAVDRTTFAAGMTGVAASGVQLVLDLWRSLWSTGAATSTLVDAIDRIDGLKMLAFAVMIGAGTAAFRRAGRFGRPMAAIGVAAVAALVASGVGYLGVDGLRGAAYASLPLLLVWVAVTARRA